MVRECIASHECIDDNRAQWVHRLGCFSRLERLLHQAFLAKGPSGMDWYLLRSTEDGAHGETVKFQAACLQGNLAPRLPYAPSAGSARRWGAISLPDPFRQQRSRAGSTHAEVCIDANDLRRVGWNMMDGPAKCRLSQHTPAGISLILMQDGAVVLSCFVGERRVLYDHDTTRRSVLPVDSGMLDL